MKKHFATALLASLALAATAYAAPKQYPGAKALPDADPMKTAIDASKQQLKSSNANAEVEAWVLPAGTTCTQVAEFYTKELKGYTQQSKSEQPTGCSIAYTNSTGAVSISFMNNMMNPAGAPYLIVSEGKAATH